MGKIVKGLELVKGLLKAPRNLPSHIHQAFYEDPRGYVLGIDSRS